MASRGHYFIMAGRYDKIFKSLGEDFPRGLLHLTGSLPLDVPAKIEPMAREINVPGLAVDQLYRVRTDATDWLDHSEAQARYRAEVRIRLAWYGVLLAFTYRLPIRTTLILMAKRFGSRRIPEYVYLQYGDVVIRSRVRVVRLWEVDARQALELKEPELLPWVMLMNGSDRQMLEAARRIRTLGKSLKARQLAAQYFTLAGLRYDKDTLPLWLKKAGNMLTDEIIRESSYYQLIVEEGLKKGLKTGMVKGLQKGRLLEARRNLRLVMSVRFPSLGEVKAIDRVDDPARLEKGLKSLLLASDEKAARAALRKLNGK